MQKKICLIIPCYNEADRLSPEKFLHPGEGVCFLFVNDGSTDSTLRILNSMKSEHVHVLDLPANAGKAEAVRAGMLHLRNLPFYEGLEWAGFWDADLATDLSELHFLLSYAEFVERDVDAVFGSRIYRLGSRISRSYVRHILGRLFATVAAVATGVKAYDSQCGAKIFRKGLIREAFGEPFVSRWIFDIELILRLKNSVVVEYPLSAWHDVKGSKVSLLRDSWKILSDLLRIRRKYI